jgi:hypothetical protein
MVITTAHLTDVLCGPMKQMAIYLKYFFGKWNMVLGWFHFCDDKETLTKEPLTLLVLVYFDDAVCGRHLSCQCEQTGSKLSVWDVLYGFLVPGRL